jgi:hypothetical protein
MVIDTCVGLVDVLPGETEVPGLPSEVGCCPCCIRQMVDDEDYAPVEFHNSNYGKGTWEIYWPTSSSRGRSSPTMGADIVPPSQADR